MSNIYDETFCINSYLAHFLNPSSKNKKSSYVSLYFGKWNFPALILRNFLHFLKRKLFLYFGKRKPRKNSLHFRKRNFLIFQETSYVLGSNFPSLKYYIEYESDGDRNKTPPVEEYLNKIDTWKIQ